MVLHVYYVMNLLSKYLSTNYMSYIYIYVIESENVHKGKNFILQELKPSPEVWRKAENKEIN